MRQHQLKNPFLGHVDRAKYWRIHRQRIKHAEPTLKVSEPSGPKSPREGLDKRKEMKKREEKTEISKNNMKLAQEIFKIMDGPGMVSEILVKAYTNHPGTNNFGQRLNEAKRIHYENGFLASRLDSVQPYYQFTRIINSPKKKTTKLKKPNHSRKKTHQYKPKDPTASLPTSPRSIRTAPMAKRYDHSSTANRSSRASKDGTPKPKNLIMEHWKIQNGKVLDVAVLKEPFEDRFSILGIDVDDGQRYQLNLSSEEVSNILEGDMLVISFDNPDVWLALIEKVNLRPVMAFVKPGSAPAITTLVSLDKVDPKEGEVNIGNSSSITGQAVSEDVADGSIVTQDEGNKYLAEEWGSLINASAIEVPINGLGPEPEYDDGFEDVDEASTPRRDDAPSANQDRLQDTLLLPPINEFSMNYDNDIPRAVLPPPFDMSAHRPPSADSPRPETAGVNRGSSNSVGNDINTAHGRNDPGTQVKIASPSVTYADFRKEPHAPVVTPAAPSTEKKKVNPSPRKSVSVTKREKESPPPLINVPWNSNVLVTKVRERMKELSAVEQEIAVKRRATEIKIHRDHQLRGKSVTIMDDEFPDQPGTSSPQKVVSKPEPPSNPRPSAPPSESGSFKSVRGRRPTAFPTKPVTDEEDDEENELKNRTPIASLNS